MCRLLARLAIGLVIVGLTGRSAARVSDWASDETLWRSAVQTDPELLRPRVNYAAALMSRGAYPDALLQWQQAASMLTLDAALPRPTQMRRMIGLNLAAIATVQQGSVSPAIQQQLARLQCSEIRRDAWACPPD